MNTKMTKFRKINSSNRGEAATQLYKNFEASGVSFQNYVAFVGDVIEELCERGGQITLSKVNCAVAEIAELTSFVELNGILSELGVDYRERNMDEFVFVVSVKIFNALKGEKTK